MTPTVLYLGGLGRSGTTLIERILGELPGVMALGEVVHLWQRDLRDGERCSCGAPLRRCQFWDAVGERAFGGWHRLDLDRVLRLQARVERTRHIPGLALGRLSQRRLAEVREYADHYRRIYHAAAELTGARVVVDSSKHSALAWCLRHATVDLRVAQIVRDPRGVAYSWTKRLVRPESDGGDEMTRYPPARSALLWNAHNAAFSLLARCGVPVTRVHYEQFLADPRQGVWALAAFAGLDAAALDLSFVAEAGVTLTTGHSAAGNPMRFTVGAIPLRRDDAWRRELPARHRRLVGALCAPLLASYGRDAAAPLPGTRDPVPIPRAGGPGRQSPSRQSPSRRPPSPPEPPNPGIPTTAAQALAADASASSASTSEPEWPSVGVVIPTRDRPELLRQALAAVQAQDYPGPVRVVVVADQSTPDQRLAGAGPPPVTVLANTRTPGLAGARNTGILALDTDLVAFCDDDDVWVPGKLRAQVAALAPEAELATCAIEVEYGGRRTARLAGRDRVRLADLTRSRLAMLHSSTFLCRREALCDPDRVGLVAEDAPGSQNEDWDLLLRATRRAPIVHVDQPLVRVLWGRSSFYAHEYATKISSLRWMLARHPELRGCRPGAARVYGQLACWSAASGDRRAAWRWAGRAVRHRWREPRAVIALAALAGAVRVETVLAALHRRGHGI